jgi:hypothetical protein
MGSQTFFFIHVMKTAGTTFTQHIQANFSPDQVYPAPSDPRDLDRMFDYYLIKNLRALTAEDRDRIRIYGGHFPYAAAALVGADTTLTILREPVARTISYLEHCRRYTRKFADSSLEEIYDDPWQFPTKIHNYQAKLFAMGEGDKLESHLDVIDIDEERLARAKAAIAAVDVLGLQEHYDDFVEDIRSAFGWTIGAVGNMRVTPPGDEVPDSLIARILEDNAADVAFYEHAVQVWTARQAARGRAEALPPA